MVTIASSTCISILSKVMSSKKNCEIFERNIRNVSDDDDMYQDILCQICIEIMDGVKNKDILSRLKSGKVGWKHPVFDEIEKVMEEQDDFVENPFEVEEGIFECKCGSTKTFSYAKQSRSSDEGTSVFVTCVVCKKQWVCSG